MDGSENKWKEKPNSDSSELRYSSTLAREQGFRTTSGSLAIDSQ